jgi:hypothetical protein
MGTPRWGFGSIRQTLTPSEPARHARAELETIALSLRLSDLARLLERARRAFKNKRNRGESKVGARER